VRYTLQFQIYRLTLTVSLFYAFLYTSQRILGSFIMVMCPRCYSNQIQLNNYGQRVVGAIGTAAGAAGGVAGAVSGAEIGATAGIIATPLGCIAGAILGGLVGGVAGCVTGAALGEVIDDHILDNYHCLSCGYNFHNDHQ
jgi:hypothetical protein